MVTTSAKTSRLPADLATSSATCSGTDFLHGQVKQSSIDFMFHPLFEDALAIQTSRRSEVTDNKWDVLAGLIDRSNLLVIASASFSASRAAKIDGLHDQSRRLSARHEQPELLDYETRNRLVTLETCRQLA